MNAGPAGPKSTGYSARDGSPVGEGKPPVLLWAAPCWVLLHTGQHWPLPVTLAGTALFALGLVGMPLAMVRGHGKRQQDRAAIVGDTLLDTSWVLFTWPVLLGVFLRLALTVADVG